MDSITVLEETFSLSPQVRILQRGVLIPASVPDDALPGLANRILAVRGFSRWALGAVLGEMVVRKPIKRDGKPTGDFDHSWANAYCEAMSLDAKERRAVLAVHTFYPQGSRDIDLSWEMYFEAMLATGGQAEGLKRALSLLREAKAGGMSVSQFRRYIRQKMATEEADPTQTEADLTSYNAVFDFRRWAARQLDRIDEYDRARAVAVLKDLADAVRFVDRLRDIADGDGNGRNVRAISGLRAIEGGR